MAAVAQIPDMNRVSVLVGEQQIGVYAVFDHIRRAPFAGDRDVVAEMPPKIVREILRPAIDFPSPEHVEALVIEQEYSAGTVASGCSESAHVDCVGSTMDRMRAAVAGARRDFL